MLASDPVERRLYEYWKKAACLIPLCNYRYSLPRMRILSEGRNKGWSEWLAQDHNSEIVDHVKARITAEGPLRTSDFEYDGPRRGSWWDWKPTKIALEHLYNSGELMIAGRVNFHRVYDLKERVLPDWVDQTEPTPEEAYRHQIEEGALALGICNAYQAAEYSYLKRTVARPVIQALVEEGVLIEVEGTTASGETIPLVLHRERLKDLQRILDGDLKAERTSFLSPFDSLFWAQGRDLALWNFSKLIEMYVPEAKRIYGYYSMPILHHDRLVGRFDPKLERKTGTLILRSLYLEPEIEPDDALVADVAAAMRDFMAFHEASNLIIEKKGHKGFRKKLLAAL